MTGPESGILGRMDPAKPRGPDARPPILRYRDAVVSAVLLIVSVLVATGLVDPAVLLVVLEHEVWATAATLAAGSAGAFFFAWVDRRFGEDVGQKLREVEHGIRDGREAAAELARGYVAPGDGRPSEVTDGDPTNPIEIRRE